MSIPGSPREFANYTFLSDMVNDSYFPDALVAKGVQILRDLCAQLDAQLPGELDSLYVLTHATTERFNELQEEFFDADSEFETVARESIGGDIFAISQAYGFTNADIEELIAPRDW